MTIDTVEYAQKRGAEAFMDGATISDNPYDKENQRDLFEAWNMGFEEEMNYWSIK